MSENEALEIAEKYIKEVKQEKQEYNKIRVEHAQKQIQDQKKQIEVLEKILADAS